VIDYTTQDCTQTGERYHLVFDVASTLTVAGAGRVLTPEGRYVLIGHDHYGGVGRRTLGSIPRMFGLMLRTPFNRHLRGFDASLLPKAEVMGELLGWLESGEVVPPPIERYPFGEVAEAHRAIESGRTVGKLVLTVGGDAG